MTIRGLSILATVLLWASVPGAAEEAPAGPKPLPRAVTGDTVLIDGRRMRLTGLDCPPFRTEEGRAAKFLLTTMLRAPVVHCAMQREGGEWVGDCYFGRSTLVRPRSMAAELRARDLCLRFGRA